MRYLFGILYFAFFVGFAACTLMLGGPPSQVYSLSDLLVGAALLCAALSLIMLGVLVSGIGATGKQISAWRVPLLCVIPLLASFGIGVLGITARSLGNKAEHLSLDAKLKLCAFGMFAFGLFTLCGLIASLILAKRHNSKLV